MSHDYERLTIFLFAVLSVFALTAADQGPQTVAPTKPRWRVWVDGAPLTLRHVTVSEKLRIPPAKVLAMGEWYDYGTCLLDKSRSFVVRADRDISALEVVPSKFGIVPKKTDERTFAFTADKPFRLSFEVEGRIGALHLFAERPERFPKSPRPGIRRFGPGEHHPGTIYLGNDETLVLDEGAVVYGAVRIIGTNVTVCGTGIISGRDYCRFQHLDAPGRKTRGFFGIRDSRQVSIRGISIERSSTWTLVVDHSSDVTIDGVKILCTSMVNDDAIDIVNSQRVTVRRTFVRSEDDGLALKGMSARKPMPPVEDIVMEDCEIWTDGANPFRFGWEGATSAIRRVRVENTDVLRYSPFFLPVTHEWTHAVFLLQPSNGMPLEDVVFRNVRIRDCGVREGLGEMFVLQAAPKLVDACRPKDPRPKFGRIRNVRLENVTLDGVPIKASSSRLYSSSSALSDVAVDGVPLREN